MKTIRINSEDCIFFLERSDDGGAVVNALAPNPDGTFDNYRHWFSDPQMALAEYESVDALNGAELIAKARQASSRLDTG